MKLQGDLYWANLHEPVGSEAGYFRPVLVVQGDSLNRSRIRTLVCVPLTSNLAHAGSPGNVLLPSNATGLPKDSVARTDLILAVNRKDLGDRAGRISPEALEQVFAGLDIVLGRD